MSNDKTSFRSFTLGLAALATIGMLSGCLTPSAIMRDEVAHRIASAAWMKGREIPASPFALTAYERMHERFAPASLYIEGDGWARYSDKDPSPKNPVALHLASKDSAANVAYLARPCQYSKLIDPEKDCKPAHWKEDRFSPEIIRAYNAALDDISARYDIQAFHLTGFDGGAAIALKLAARRDDILSVRTVAGQLDAVEETAVLHDLPQHHFIGGQDELTPPAVLHSYLQAIGPSDCVHHSLIHEASHEKGWVEKWPELLKKPFSCTRLKVKPEPFEQLQQLDLIPYDDESIRIQRELPEKP